MPVNPNSPNTGLLYNGSGSRKFSNLLSSPNKDVIVEYGLSNGILQYRVRKEGSTQQFSTINQVINSLSGSESDKNKLRTLLVSEANKKLNIIESSNPRPNTTNNQTPPTTPQTTSGTAPAATPTTPTTSAGEEKQDAVKKQTITIGNLLEKIDLSYPKDLQTKNQTYVEFKSYDFKVLQSTQDVYGIVGPISANIFEFLNKAGNAQLNADVKPYPSDSIKLYVPPSINVSYGANWGVGELGPALGYMTGETGVGGAVKDLAGATLISGFEGIKTKLTGILGNIQSASIDADQLFGLTTGLVANRNEFSTFSNMSMRSFNYSFLMVARNKEESDSINKIINCFKTGMHPFGGTTKVELSEKNKTIASPRTPILKYPKIWTIEYKIKSSSNRFLPRTKYCALVNVQLNYTPNSVFNTLIDDSIPAIQIDLAFQELTTLTGNEIVDGEGLNFEKGDSSTFNGTGLEINGLNAYLPKAGGTF